MDYERLIRVGRLCSETGLTHAEVGQMDADRVERLLLVQETVSAWHAAKIEQSIQE